jgi:hypothetical protein
MEGLKERIKQSKDTAVATTKHAHSFQGQIDAIIKLIQVASAEGQWFIRVPHLSEDLEALFKPHYTVARHFEQCYDSSSGFQQKRFVVISWRAEEGSSE